MSTLSIKNFAFFAINKTINLFGGSKEPARIETRHPLHDLYRLIAGFSSKPLSAAEKQNSILSYIKKIDVNLQNWIYERVYTFSTDPTKGGEAWGEHHVTDNVDVLAKAINNIALAKLHDLKADQRLEVLSSLPSKENETEYVLTALNRYGLLKGPSTAVPYLPRVEKLIFSIEAWRTAGHPSTSYDLLRKEPPKGRIGYVNGIKTAFDRVKWDAEQFSEHLAQGYNIHVMYSATYGTKLDMFKCALGFSEIVMPTVKLIHKQWIEFFEKSIDPEEKYLQLCYCAGSIEVYNALRNFPEELRTRIIVLAIAPAHTIPQKLAYKVYNYVIPSDEIRWYDPNRHLIDSKSSEVVFLPEQTDNPHNPHGSSYKAELEKEIGKFIIDNDIF